MGSNYASESGHWYDKDGTPHYTVPAKKGGERATTIRDARKLGLLPSVTGIIRCAAAPGLESWKADQLLLAAMTLERRPDESEADWLKRVKSDSREEGKAAAQLGTDIHTSIERRLLGQEITEWIPHTEGAIAAVEQLCGKREWRPEKSFAHPLGFGGKADLHCIDSDPILLDFKSNEFSDVGEVTVYDEHRMQLAACRRGLRIDTARCGIVFVSRSVPGLATIIECSQKEIEQGWRMFLGLLDFFQAKNGWPWTTTQ